MAVTLRDVAARAGVSPVVVSRVLHNKAVSVRVSDATAERVRQAAADLGYRVNIWARNFRMQQTMMIGVLHGLGFERNRLDRGSRYFAALMEGIVEGAFRHGYSVTLCPKLLGSSPEDAMTDGRFDGLVWYSTLPSEENHRMLMSCSVPLVVIHEHAAHFDDRFPCVICDNDQGIRLAVEHLALLGHRHIAYVWDGLTFNLEARERRRSFEAHMDRLGLPRDGNSVLDFRRDPELIDRYMASKRPHTALITYSEEAATLLYDGAKRCGVRIPDDISVIGFDSTDYCNELNPGLTAVSQPLNLMGETAIELLVQSINGQTPDPLEIVLPCGLDVRGSTKSIEEQVNSS